MVNIFPDEFKFFPQSYLLPYELNELKTQFPPKKGGNGVVRIVDGYDGDGLDNAALNAGWYGRLVIPSYFIFNGSQVQDLIGVHVVSIGNYDDGVAVIEVHHGLPDLLIENIDGIVNA